MSADNHFTSSNATIRLLDSQVIDIELHPRLSAGDVLHYIAEKCDVSTSDARFFALSFKDVLGNFHWLDASVILCDMVDPAQPTRLHLSHQVRFFVSSIYELQSALTVKMYFLEVHGQLIRHELNVFEDDYIELVALMLSVYAPECPDDSLPELLVHILPSSHPPHLLRHATHDLLDRKILDRFLQLKGAPTGNYILSFLRIAERSDSYGYRFYHVRDDANQKCLLSIGSKGILVYQALNITKPIYTFHWRLLDNLYYRDTKFSVEMRESKKSPPNDASVSLNVSQEQDDLQLSEAFNDPTTQVTTTRRRTQNRVLIYNFACETPLLCRTVWSSSIAQHQFFLEQRALIKKGRSKPTIDHREFTEKLNRLTSNSSLASSLPSLSSLHSSASSSGSMPAAKVADTSMASLPPMKTSTSMHFYPKSEEEVSKDRARYNVLRKRRAELEASLINKLAELKGVCIEEGDLTGEMPIEMNEALMPGELMPRLKRRVGTTFSIPEELIKLDKEDKMSQLETDVELHRRIVAAASRLATDKNMNKSVRRKRQKDLQAAKQKLSRLETGLMQMRHSHSKPDISSLNSDTSSNSWSHAQTGTNHLTMAMTNSKSCPTTPHGSVPDLSNGRDERSEQEEPEDEDRVHRRAPSSASRLITLQQRYSGISSSSASTDSLGLGLPPRPTSRKSVHSSQLEMGSPLTDHANIPYENMGYRSTSYRSSYRQAHYPTIQDEQQHHRKRAQSAHTIGFENNKLAGSGACSYSIPMNDAGEKFITMNEDDDLTPTADQAPALPVRRMTSSVSCQAGFTTASLDRRYAKNGPAQRSQLNTSQDETGARSHCVTTFPVQHQSNTVILSGKPYSASELPRFQPRPAPHFLSRGSLPQYPGRVGHQPPAPTSSSQTNPQMEALLSYYKQQQHQNQPPSRNQTPKTATIV